MKSHLLFNAEKEKMILDISWPATTGSSDGKQHYYYKIGWGILDRLVTCMLANKVEMISKITLKGYSFTPTETRNYRQQKLLHYG